jgi:hypothetical protein
LLTTELNLSLALGLSAIGQADEAISLIDESLAQVETNGNLLYVPELLRVKGTILVLLPEPDLNNAEISFLQALELSRHQDARAWELCIAWPHYWPVEGKSLKLRSSCDQYSSSPRKATVRQT